MYFIPTNKAGPRAEYSESEDWRLESSGQRRCHLLLYCQVVMLLTQPNKPDHAVSNK